MPSGHDRRKGWSGSCNAPNPCRLRDFGPDSHKLFKPRSGIELHKPLAQWKPFRCGLLNDHVRHLQYQDNRSAFVGGLPRLALRILVRVTEMERAVIQIHREPVFRRLSAGFTETRVRPEIEDLFGPPSSRPVKQDHGGTPSPLDTHRTPLQCTSRADPRPSAAEQAFCLNQSPRNFANLGPTAGCAEGNPAGVRRSDGDGGIQRLPP